MSLQEDIIKESRQRKKKPLAFSAGIRYARKPT